MESSTNWIQVDILTTTAGIEPVGASLLALGIPGYQVQDAADFEQFLQGKQGRWDYIDDDLMKLRHAPTVVSVYLAENQQGRDTLAALQAELSRLRALDETHQVWGGLTCTLQGLREEDWANAWKQYYHAVKVGSRLIICPSWEEYHPADGETVLHLDPGMAFGTGTHETTRLCLELLDEVLRGGERVLDIGCGSGILSVAALLLGADSALGVDIDQTAVNVARENAALNGVEAKSQYLCSNLAESATGRYHIIFANIVADVILSLLPDVPALLESGGAILLSGIIDTREEEILAGIAAAGLSIRSRREENGWVALLCGLGEAT